MKHLKGIHYLIVMLVMPVVTPAKTNSNTDLTSDFASTVDDQYTWSVSSGGGGGGGALLAQHHDQQGKGPTVLQEEPLEWKWRTAENGGDDDRSGGRPIDRFLQSPWKKKSNKVGKKIVQERWNGHKVEDQGPGSIEIYRLGKIDEEDLDRLQMLPPWNNPSLLHKKLPQSKTPKKVYGKSTLKIVQFPNVEGKIPSPPSKETNTHGVPELQIGCEGGLEALPMELTKRVPRSIYPPRNGSSSRAHSHEGESTVVPQPPPVNPVTIDWDYNEHNYEEMDELLRLKELEKIINKKVRARGDMRPDDYEEAEWDMKKVPLRGDLVGSRKVRSILNQPVNLKRTWPGRNKNDDLWGFGENDGYISEAGDVADYDEDSVERIEAEKRRKEYDRRQREEWEKRRREQLERQNNQRNQQGARRNDNRVNTEIDNIRKEYEARLTAEQREMERKLKDYIERNRPIVVESPDDKYRRQLEEFRRLSEMNRNNNQPVRPQDRSRGPSLPATYPSPSWPSDAEARHRMEDEARRRQQEEYQRRRDEENRRMDERRRQQEEEERRRKGQAERHNQTSNNPVNDDWWRRRVEEEKRRMEIEKRKEAENRGDNNPRMPADTRRLEAERRRGQVEAENQTRNKPVDEPWRKSEDRRRQDEERRRYEAARRRLEDERRQEVAKERGQSQPNNNPDRARQEAERRRQEMERRRLEEAQRRQEDPRRRAEEERRRQDAARRAAAAAAAAAAAEEQRRQEQARRREEEEEEKERRNRLMEQKRTEWGVKVLSEAEKRKLDEARLNSLPVGARIIISPRGLGTRPTPNFGSRGDFGDVDLTPINPSRPGHPVQNFPAPPTRRPPSKPPSPCVWAVVQCCGTQNDPKRLNNCFEYVGCPGVNWDPSPCRGSVADAAREEVVQYYASADQA